MSSLLSRTSAALPVLVVLAIVPFWPDGELAKWLVLYAAAIPAAIWLALRAREVDRADLLTIALIAWAALSLTWSQDWQAGLLSVQKMAVLGLLFLFFRRVPFSWTGLTVAVGLIFGLIAFLPSGFLGFGLPEGGFRNENAVTAFLLVAIPLLIGQKSPISAALALISAIYLVQFNSSKLEWAVLLAFVAGGLFWWAGDRWDRAVIVMGAAGLACIVLVVVMVHVPDVRWSILDRLNLNAGAALMWSDAPLTGHGAGSFDYLWPKYQNADRQMLPGLAYLGSQDGERFPGTAHNDFLQILAELGLVGFLLFGAIVLSAKGRSLPAILALGALATVALIEFPLQRAGTAMLGMMALAQLSPVQRPLLSRWVWRAGAAVTSIAAATGLYVGIQEARANYWYGITRYFLEDSPAYADAFRANIHAYELFPADPTTRRQLFRTLTAAFINGNIGTLDSRAVDAFYAISRSAGPEDRGLLISRIAFLGTAGLCGSECDAILATMHTNEPRLHLVNRLEEVVHSVRAL